MRRVFPFLVMVLAAVAQGQPPATMPPNDVGRIARGGPGRGGPPPIVSPEVLPDRRVVFRLRAPKANEVNLTGDLWAKQTVVEKMTRDAEGVCSITVGPLTPDVYGYSSIIDGVTISDPSNGWVRHGVRSSSQSAFRVPGEQEQFLEVPPVPHGDVRIVYFKAESLGKIRRMHVYLPPGYDTSKARYPVLYLIHGAGKEDDGWISTGMANIILDNLMVGRRGPLAERRCGEPTQAERRDQSTHASHPFRLSENYFT